MRAEITAYRRFQQLSRELVETSSARCPRLRAARFAAPAAKKGAVESVRPAVAQAVEALMGASPADGLDLEAGTDLADRWGKARRDELDAERIDAILTELRAHTETCEEARKCIDYLTRNRHRNALSGVPRGGSLRVVGRRRGRVQGRHRRPAQARRHAMDGWPGSTPSSPCGAASSAAASRISGNDEPPRPPDSHLTNLTCTRLSAFRQAVERVVGPVIFFYVP